MLSKPKKVKWNAQMAETRDTCTNFLFTKENIPEKYSCKIKEEMGEYFKLILGIQTVVNIILPMLFDVSHATRIKTLKFKI
jgi:hypothetical protein